MPVKYKPVKFDEIDFKKEVNTELENDREINALFLIHGYVEAYLREWLFASGPFFKKKISKKIIENIERISFNNLLHVHLILGNISELLYSKVKALNDSRNEFAHKIIKIDINDKVTKTKIKKIVLNGIEVCGEVFKLYKKTLDERAKLIK